MTSSEKMLVPLFQELPDGVCVTGAEGEIIYLNPAAVRILEGKPEELKGKNLCGMLCGHLSDTGHVECASSCPLRDPENQEKVVIFKGRYGPKVSYDWKENDFRRVERWRDLRVRCVRVPSKETLKPAAERHFVLIEDAQAERELQRQSEDWRNMVAHDLKVPLTSIYLTLRELQDHPGEWKGSPVSPRMVDLSVGACRTILDLLHLYLDISKLDARLMELAPKELDVRTLVSGQADEQASAAAEAKVEIDVSIPKDLTVYADEALLARIVQNLLSNAIKYSGDGKRVVLSARRDGRQVEISVKDDGAGIAPESIPHIFDRYYQAKARQAGKLKGTGLGLTFCRQAVNAMDGEIRVDSKVGEGSVFSVRLPARRAT